MTTEVEEELETTPDGEPVETGPLARSPAEIAVDEEPIAPEVARTMRVSIHEGCATMVFLNWTAGSVLAGYLLYHGASAFQVGMAASIPLLAQAIAPFAAWIQGVFPRRRLLTTLLSGIGRGLWIVPPLLPVFLIPGNVAVPMILFVVGVSSTMLAAAGAIWSAWMGEIVPASRRGRYFGLRGGIHAVVGMGASLFAGWMLDTVPAPLNFQILFVVAVVFAAVGVYLYTKHHEPANPIIRLPFHQIFTAPIRDLNFRRFLLFAIYWQIAVFIAAPYVYPYFISHLQLTFTQIAVWQAIAIGLILFTGPFWGKMADRYGNKPILTISTIMAGSILPASWMLARPGEVGMIWFSGVLDALCWGAITPALFNLALATASAEKRLAYLSIFSLAVGLAGFAGGVIGGYLMLAFASLEFTLFGFEWTRYHWVFLVAMAARVQAFRFLRPLVETNAWRTRDVWRMFMRWRLAGFFWR